MEELLLCIISISVSSIIGVIIGILLTIYEKISEIRITLYEIKTTLLYCKEAHQIEDKKK